MPPAVVEIPYPPSAVVEREPSKSRGEAAIVDVDAFEYEEILK